MKQYIFLPLFFLGRIFAQDTFSIVAVDSTTGEVGSAGASCISNCIIISDVHPGLGAVHTQASWYLGNKTKARTLMDLGYSPQFIIDSVTATDAGGDSSIRQYGVVDLVNGGRSAAFTGSNCMTYKSHIVGFGYAIQGNILLGQEILDSMEARFLREPGPLCDKLMAALQGANVSGADTRCMADGKPAISSFIRVAKPGDNVNALYLDLKVNNTYSGQNPIDSLQFLLDQFKTQTSVSSQKESGMFFRPFYQEGKLKLHFFRSLAEGAKGQLSVFDLNGKALLKVDFRLSENLEWDFLPPSAGIYMVNIAMEGGNSCAEKFSVF